MYLTTQAIAVASGLIAAYQPRILGVSPGPQAEFSGSSVYAARLLGTTLCRALAAVFPFGPTHGIFFAVMAVSGVSIVLTAMLLRRMLPPGMWLAAVAALALSSYVMTPYDGPRALAIVGIMYLARRGASPWLLCAATGAGVATHEAVLTVVPALALTNGMRRTLAPALAGVATYLALHIGFHAASLTPMSLTFNTYLPGLLGLVTALWFSLWMLRQTRGMNDRGRAVYWLACVPYLAVCVYGGAWLEAPRLVAPLLICTALVACRYGLSAEPLRQRRPAVVAPLDLAQRALSG